MERTIEDWFSTLPEPTRTAALAARSKTLARKSTHSRTRTALNLADAILYGFEWNVDDTRAAKWSTLFDSLIYKESPLSDYEECELSDIGELIKLGDAMFDRLNAARIVAVNGTGVYDDDAIMADSEAQDKWNMATAKYRKS